MTDINDVTNLVEAYGVEQLNLGAASRQDEVDVLRDSVSRTETTLQEERTAHAVTRGQRDAALRRIQELENPQPAFAVGMAYKSNTDPAPVEARLGRPVDVSKTYYGPTEQNKAIARIKANIAADRAISEISFKVPHSWVDMAAGKGDTWAKSLLAQIRAAIADTGHLVRIAFHHEPEDEAKTDPVQRDRWKAMQVRLAPIFDVPGVEFLVILMGYHSLNKASSYYKVWRLDLAVPDHPAIKGVGYDLYETRGVVRDDGTVAGWRDFNLYLGRIKAFHDTRPGLKWGFSEHSATELAETEKPGRAAAIAALIAKYGGSWLVWFNSNLNSVAGWEMAAGSPREKAFAVVLKAGITA